MQNDALRVTSRTPRGCGWGIWSGLVWSDTLSLVTRIVNISEAKAQLSRLVEEAQSGGRVIIGRAGRPVAVLTAYDGDPAPRTLGAWKDQVWIAGDFDDPLPDAVQRGFEGTEP